MSTRLNPYLNFRDTTRQAMEFYRDVFGGELTMNTFAEFGQADTPNADNIMHGSLETTSGKLGSRRGSGRAQVRGKIGERLIVLFPV